MGDKDGAAPTGAVRPRLLEQLRDAIRRRHYSYRTEESYVHWVRRFIRFAGLRHPRELGAAEVTAFLNYLARDREVAAATQNQALSALLFLYKEVLALPLPWLDGPERAKRPVRLPAVLTRDEAQRLLSQLHGTKWLMASLLYGAGLRLRECLKCGSRTWISVIGRSWCATARADAESRVRSIAWRAKGRRMELLEPSRSESFRFAAGGRSSMPRLWL